METTKKEQRKRSWWPLFVGIWPKKPMDIKSLYEIGVLFVFFILCLFLYVKANNVTVVNEAIRVACLDDVNKNNSDSLYTGESFGKTYANVRFILPMTNSNNRGILKEDLPDSIVGGFINVNLGNTSVLNSMVRNLYKERKTWQSEGICIDSLLKQYDEKLKSQQLERREGLPSYYVSINTYLRNNEISILPIRVRKTDSVFKATKDSLGYQKSGLDRKRKVLWMDFFMNGLRINMKYSISHFGTVGNNSVFGNPGWWSLEDISQYYFKIKLRTYSIDSTRFELNLVGATEFSQMNPQPDSIDMNSIVFTDQKKIEQIKNDGLLFHAKFKELENMQNIRMFVLTSVIGGIGIILLGFLILFLYGWWFSLPDNVKKGMKRFLFSLIIGLIVYCFLWVYHVDDENRDGYWIFQSIIIALFITWMIYSKVRKRIKFFVIILSVMAVFLFIGISKWIEDYWDYDKMESSGNYKRETILLCNRIMSNDTVSSEDYMRLQKLLSITNNSIPLNYNSIVLKNAILRYDNLQNDLLVVDQTDYVFVFDLKQMHMSKFAIPGSEFAFIEGSYIFRNTKTKDSIFIARLENPTIVYKIKGYAPVLADGGKYVITCDKKNSCYVYRMARSPQFVRKLKLYSSYRLEADSNNGMIAFVLGDNSKKVIVYDLDKLKKVSVNNLKGNRYSTSFFNNMIMRTDYKTNKVYMYDIYDNLSMKYELKGHNLKFGNNGKMVLVTFGDNQNIYFHKFSSGKFLTDSIKYQGKILSSNKGIVLYDSIEGKVFTYDVENGSSPLYSVCCSKAPVSLPNGYFYTYEFPTYSVYDNKHHICDIPQSSSIIGNYEVKKENGLLKVKPFCNPSMEYVVEDSNICKMSVRDLKIFNGWIYAFNDGNLYMVNTFCQPIEDLIKSTNVLSDREKKKLIEKLGQSNYFNNR